MIRQAPDRRGSVVRRAGSTARAGFSLACKLTVPLNGAALALTVLLASCAAYLGQRVESVILEALPRVVGPADHYDAVVRGASADLSHFDQVFAVGTAVRRPNSPVLERVQLDLLDIAVDRNARQITSIGNANVSVTLSASALAAYLGRQRWIAEPVVRVVAPATVIVSGRLTLTLTLAGLGQALGLSPVSMGEFRGHLTTHESQLLLGVDSVRLDDREAPAFARRLIEQGINPLFDVGGYSVPSRIDSVKVERNAIVVIASGSQIIPSNGN